MRYTISNNQIRKSEVGEYSTPEDAEVALYEERAAKGDTNAKRWLKDLQKTRDFLAKRESLIDEIIAECNLKGFETPACCYAFFYEDNLLDILEDTLTKLKNKPANE